MTGIKWRGRNTDNFFYQYKHLSMDNDDQILQHNYHKMGNEMLLGVYKSYLNRNIMYTCSTEL